MRVKRKTMFILLFALIAGVFTACEQNDNMVDNSNNPGNNGGNQSVSGTGNVNFVLTDAPFPANMVAEANVTIDKISIRKVIENETDSTSTDSTNMEMDASGFVTVSEETQTFNLLDLRNGVTADLTEAELDTGMYDQMRLHVVSANVVLNDEDSTTYDLKIPGGSTSGLKIKIKDGLNVSGGSMSTVLLDFDVSKSFVVKGNPKTPAGIKGFIFKPVVRAVVTESTGEENNPAGNIAGHVTVGDSINVNNATIEIYQMDSLITSALTDSTGYYAALGIPVGNYDLKCMADGYDESDVNNVAVSANDTTMVDFMLEPMASDTTSVSDSTSVAVLGL